jgi:hypothetical protein
LLPKSGKIASIIKYTVCSVLERKEKLALEDMVGFADSREETFYSAGSPKICFL